MNPIDYGTTNNAKVTHRQTSDYFPNLAALHEDTEFWAYREFKPMKDLVEITLFYREPGGENMRLDAEIEGKFLTEGLELGPENIKIVHLGKATEAVK